VGPFLCEKVKWQSGGIISSRETKEEAHIPTGHYPVKDSLLYGFTGDKKVNVFHEANPNKP